MVPPDNPNSQGKAITIAAANMANAKQEYIGKFALDAFNHTTTADGAKAILAQLQQRISEAKNDKYKQIAGDTVAKISNLIKTDEDFRAYKDELNVLPNMLSAQLAIDQFKDKMRGRVPTPEEQAIKDQLDKQYIGVMPTVRGGASGSNKHLVSEQHMMMAPMTGDHPSGNPPSKAPPSIMGEFHDFYGKATTEWDQKHPAPPVPGNSTPAGTPGTLPGGNGGATPNTGNVGGGAGIGGFPPPGHMDGMITENPDQPSNWRLRADYKLHTGDYNGAQTDAERAVALGGGAAARVTLGQAKLQLNDFPGANEQARAALEAEPQNQEAVALLHFSAGRIAPGASSAAAGPSAAAPATGNDAATAAQSAAKRAAFLNQASNVATRMSGAQAEKAAVNALHLNDLQEAMVYANRALVLDPRNAAFLNLRASIYARGGDYTRAAQDAQAGLLLAPNNPALLRTLTYAQLRGKDYKGALASSSALLEIDPQDAYTHALRAHAYGSLGDREAMMKDINRAAALDDRFAGAAEQARTLQIPSDQDILFLFPGEGAPGAAVKTAARPERNRRFGWMAGSALAGGLLLALGLLQTVLAPLKEQVSSVFTRITRTGPSVSSLEGATPQPASVSGFLPGLIRGQYQIIKQIGQGGMGTVYEGTDRSLGRRVAIKKMRDEIRRDPRERARFVIEAKTVAALHHPNVVDIYAIAEDGEDVYLVFEYVEGKTVHDVVHGNGRLEPNVATRITRASADALSYAHSRGVIHRDMKPSNVMLDGQGRVKVMDFGIARMAKDSATRYSMTNTVVGTPPYMAPEQEQGQGRLRP